MTDNKEITRGDYEYIKHTIDELKKKNKFLKDVIGVLFLVGMVIIFTSIRLGVYK